MATMQEKMRACMTPHAMMHYVFGAGIGLLLAGLFSGLAAVGVTLGIIVLIIGFVGDFLVNKGVQM